MPFVSVTLAEGRTPETLRRLISEITDAVVRSGAAPKENVRVVLVEVPPTHFAAADVTLAERHTQTTEATTTSAAGEESTT
ncbi:2-hydroxymuconate tautomerase [Phycicoccus elongatus]|uniref:2-hydroxymuconate tautomerase n=1 Tax=Phycicoccus elongatus TaxID=101689 RepID=UPI003783AD99